MTISTGTRSFQNRSLFLRILACMLLSLVMGGCGYYNPNMLAANEGPPIRLYIPIWPNPTAEVGLETRIQNALSDYFIQQKRFILTRNKKDADYVLSGSINSVTFPGRSYTSTDQATALKALLNVSFKMENPENGLVILQQSGMVLQETYSISESVTEDDENKDKALETMTGDLAEQVYIRTIIALRRYERYKKNGAQAKETAQPPETKQPQEQQ